MFHYLRYILVFVYLVYAVSPLMGSVDKAPLGGLTAARTEVSLRLLVLDRLLSFVFDDAGAAEQGEIDTTEDVMVKKFRCLPAGNSLGKKIISEGHTEMQHIVQDLDDGGHEQRGPVYIAVPEPIPHIFDGYSTLHSGQSPPLSLLS